MIVKKNSLILDVWVVVMLIFAHQAYARKDMAPYVAENDNVRKWFISHDEIISKWNPRIKLGVAEYLNFVFGEQYDDKEVMRKKIDAILEDVESISCKDVENKELVIRACILRLQISDSFGDKYERIASKLTKLDPDNGFVWMLYSERYFFINDYKYRQYCEKALKCKQFSFHNKYSKRYMLEALEKAGLVNRNILLMLVLNLDNDKTYFVAERQVAILSFLRVRWGTDIQKMTDQFAARKYLSYLCCSGEIGDDIISLHTLHLQLLRSVNPEVSKSKNWKDLINQEQKYLDGEFVCMNKEFKTIENFVKNANCEDLKNYIINNEKWRIKNLPGYKQEFSLAKWKELWEKYDQRAIDIFKNKNKYKSLDQLRKETGPPGFIPPKQ